MQKHFKSLVSSRKTGLLLNYPKNYNFNYLIIINNSRIVFKENIKYFGIIRALFEKSAAAAT